MMNLPRCSPPTVPIRKVVRCARPCGGVLARAYVIRQDGGSSKVENPDYVGDRGAARIAAKEKTEIDNDQVRASL